MRLYFIAKKWLKQVTDTAKLETDNSIQAGFLDLGKYVKEDYMKSYSGIEEVTAVQEIAITLPQEMDNTDYDIQLTVEDVDISVADAGKVSAFVKAGTKTTTGFTARWSTVLAAGETTKIHWTAKKQ